MYSICNKFGDRKPVYMIKTKVAFFGGPAFIQPIKAIWKVFKKLLLTGKNPDLQNATFVLIM